MASSAENHPVPETEKRNANESYYMTREVESFDRTVTIKQDLRGELGATVWDAALVLAKYFENTEVFPPGHFKGKRVFELGAGTGLVGIVLGMQDRANLLPLLQDNIQLNHCTNRVTTAALEWGEDCTGFSPPLDYVIASDVVAGCYRSDFPKLVKTLSDLSDANTTILLSYEIRSKEDLEFFSLLKQQFDYLKVPNSRLDPLWQSEDIGIFTVKKKT